MEDITLIDRDTLRNGNTTQLSLRITKGNNCLTIGLHHNLEEPPVAEIVIDFFDDKVRALLFDLDLKAKKGDSWYTCDEWAKEIVVTDKWSEYKPSNQ